ncbi:hypothetical protein ACFXGT_11455 [Streptomyces sp. NPDC059352]|uniref:hypothetical protein n=1 Tax=Streptomyces sp. NPDC059352 TaxID=3346810 RepID=UPI0036B0DD0C
MTEARYELVDASKLPAGRVCRILEEPGLTVVRIMTGEATERLCEELNAFHRSILTEERWTQTPITDPHRIEQPAEGLGIADAQWELDSSLPASIPCVLLEDLSRLTWLIHEDDATKRLCREMNRYLKRIIGDGLWRQNWTIAS